MSKPYVYDIIVTTDKGKIPCQHISVFGFDYKMFAEFFKETHPDIEIKSIKVLSKTSYGKSNLIQQLLQRR